MAALALTVALPNTSTAKTTKALAYPYDVVWSTTVRLIRVDRGYKITDKDKDNGYLLFVYLGDGAVKQCPASLELIPITEDDGLKAVSVELDIQRQPSYVAVQLLDQLEQKLREEHGPPHDTPPPPPKKPPKKDGEKKAASGAFD